MNWAYKDYSKMLKVVLTLFIATLIGLIFLFVYMEAKHAPHKNGFTKPGAWAEYQLSEYLKQEEKSMIAIQMSQNTSPMQLMPPEPKPIKNFNDLYSPVYLRYEYITPEKVSKQFGAGCTLSEVEDFGVYVSRNHPDMVRVYYSGSTSKATVIFYKTISTRGRQLPDPQNPLPLFIFDGLCLPK